MDTNTIILKSWQHTFNTVLGRDPDFEVIKQTFGEPLDETMAKLFPDRDTHEMVETYRNYQRHIYKDDITMFPGTKEVIEELKRRGFRVAIVTSRLWSSTTQGLYKFDIAHMFDAVVSAEDTTIHKPDPTPILLCLDKLGIGADEALMVGDSKFDILCARNAGVPSVLVSWTISVTDEQRAALAPDYYIEDPAEILGIVEAQGVR
jgi:pyrophosphatase PpaX